MTDSTEKLQRELQAAQRTVAELQDKLESRETTHRLTTLELEENRSALLFMLEDLEAGRKKIEQAHQEWVSALDVVDDPIFLHDKEFRILRCNKAYQQCAGIPFDEFIGRLYYEIFPKIGAPLSCCLRAMEKAEEEEEVAVGDAIYRSRAFSVHDEQGAYLYSVHTLEDITERKRQVELTAALLELYTSAETLDEKTLLQRGLDKVQHLTGSRIGFLHFVSEDQNEIGLVTWSNDTLAHYCQAAFERHYPVSAAGIWADCIRLKQPVIINDYATAPGKKGLPEGHADLQRFISMPVFEGTQVRMIVGVGNAARDYDEHDVEMVKLFGYGLYRIVQRKRAEAALQESETKYRLLIESLQEGIWMIDKDANTSFVNLRMAQMLGYSVGEMQGRHLFSFMDERGKEIATQNLERRKQGISEQHDFELLRKDGSRIYTSMATSPILDQAGNYAGALAGVMDITERKQAEEELRLRAQLLDSASDTIFMVDFDGNFVYLNEAAWKTRGYTRDEMMGINLHALDTPKYEKLIESRMRNLMGNGQCIFESEHRRKDGSVMPVEINAHIVESGGRKLVLSVIRDITERKQAEEALKESEEKYRSIYENTQVGLYRTRISDGKLVMANDAMAKMFGFDSAEEATAKYITSEHYVDPGTRGRLLGAIQKYGGFDNFEACLTRNDGIARWFQYSGRFVQNKGYIEGVATDITERKQAEAAVQHANRALATLSAVNRTLVRAANEDELLQAICQAIVEQRGYRLAWVGYKQHDESKSLKIMARAGHDEGYLDTAQISWAEIEHGMGPSGRAIRSGTTQLCQDIANDPQYIPWRDAALKCGHAASIALPLLNESNTVFGILNVYAGEANAFTPNEIDLLEEMAGDLAFGVRSLHTRRERDLALVKNQQHLAQLKDSLEDTVRAMAGLVEMRDPYTAGHQARVADLAAAIAKQMGLPEEQVHAIHLAGTVHDLGKIKIPAEILSKPGKITDLEFGLIKVHPQAGYDILKGINFPWPIALMVLQHHERFDGSGYPQGLKGEAILLEARILAVADMVEAMSSHRPYRPGLGIEIALAEITKQRGIYFDPQVVDACLALFCEQHYSFRI